ncbi:MAG TPA: class I SAM-dependent methyltransferase, partial [Burkholderiales bacterium]
MSLAVNSRDPDRTELTLDELREIARRTIENYERVAGDFWAATRDHDVSQNIAALLDHIDATPPYTLLDLGCGPGRDLKVFAALGHVAIGVEGAAPFADMARAYSGCEVWQLDFLALDLPAARFDGIYANASL